MYKKYESITLNVLAHRALATVQVAGSLIFADFTTSRILGVTRSKALISVINQYSHVIVSDILVLHKAFTQS